jgi:FkbH-like protein
LGDPNVTRVWSPLLPEQLRFYFLHAMNAADPDIYICRTLRIRGEVDIARLRDSALELTRRHDVLRAYCRIVDDRPQLSLREDVGAAIRTIAVSTRAECDAIVASEHHIDEPFALDEGPLFRITIVTLGDETVVVLRFHHLIVDGTSVRLFIDGLLDTYAADQPLERPAQQFCEFASWESRRSAAAGSEDRAYWSRVLARPTALDLATGPRPARHTKRADTLHVVLDAALVTSLRQACRRHYVTPYIVVATLSQLLLHAVSGAADVVVGTPVAARPRREFQPMLGVLLNWIALRARFTSGTTFKELLVAARSELPNAYARQCTYEALLAAATVERDLARSPLFQATVNYARHEPLRAPAGLAVELDPVEVASTHYDLAFRFEEVGDTLRLGLTYYADAIDRASAERWCAAFVELATRCLDNEDAGLADVIPAFGAKQARTRRVAIAATFTADALEPLVTYWLARIGLASDVEIAPLDQIFQSLLDPAGIMATNRTGPNVVLVRLDDWKDPAHGVRELQRVLATQAERSAAETIVVACPSSTADDALEAELARVAESRRVHFVSYRDILARYPVDVIDEPSAAAYARAPYSSDFDAALALAIARAINAVIRPAPKVLVLDCDHTLWRGVVGEDGTHGLVVDEGHAKLQRLAAAAVGDGTLLCLASKNNEADVWAAFATTPGFALTRQMVTAHRIDWQPKSANLRALAKELGLGLDTFVFVDDSPVECAEVRAACPEVLVLQLPAESGRMCKFLDHVWPLDRRRATDTDRKRAALYAANAQRERLRAETTDLSGFIASLEVETRFVACSPETVARAAQLTQRTNQFTTTTRRRTEANLEAVIADGGGVLLVDASDRFGDYGIVGCAVYTAGLHVDSFMLSCRALGRGIEQRMLAELGRLARATGLTHVTVEVRRSPRNKPARAFFEAVAGPHRVGGASDDVWSYAIPTDEACTPQLIVASAVEAEDATHVAEPLALHEVWRELAALDTVAKIRREVERALARTRDTTTPFVAPRDELEASLAAIWSEVLNVDGIGVDDDYFAIGGDSIRSLALVARLVAAGLPVSVPDVHHHPTVARLAAALRGREITARVPAISAYPTSGPYPLAFAQRYVLAAYAAQNGPAPTAAFHVQDRFAIADPRGLSIDALCRAARLLVAGTPILHTRVARDGSQVELATYPDPISVEDLGGLDKDAQQAAISARLFADRMRPFDPYGGREAMIRLAVFVTSATTCELLVTAHHAFCDGWSLQAFYNRLFELYRANEQRTVAIERALAGDQHGYRELVHHEQEAARSPNITAFWREYLAARPLAHTPRRVDIRYQRRVLRRLDPRVLARATERVRGSRTSMKAVMLEAASAAFARDVASPLVAVVTNGRHEALSRPTEVFGLCWTFVPVVVRRELPHDARLAALHADLLATEAHARYPLADMFYGHDPAAIAPVSFNLTNFHHATWDRGSDLEVTRHESFHRFHFPVNIGVQLGDGMTVKVTWTTEHDEQAIHALVDRFAAELG